MQKVAKEIANHTAGLSKAILMYLTKNSRVITIAKNVTFFYIVTMKG